MTGPTHRGTGFWILERDNERRRQGIGNRPIEGVPKPSAGVVLRRERLGGILSRYYRTAA